jgi:hypothetical protein
MFERSGVNSNIFPIAMVFGVLSGFMIGILLNVIAYKVPLYIYLVLAVILLAGGLFSLVVGIYAFAIWRIFIFITDSLVDIRAFPRPNIPIRTLNTQRLLFLIIFMYFSAQYALVTLVV